MWQYFQNSLTALLRRKFGTKFSLKILLYHKRVTWHLIDSRGQRPVFLVQPCSFTSVSIFALSFMTVASGGGVLATSCTLSTDLQHVEHTTQLMNIHIGLTAILLQFGDGLWGQLYPAIFCLIPMCNICLQQEHTGSKVLLQQNRLVLNWEFWLTWPVWSCLRLIRHCRLTDISSTNLDSSCSTYPRVDS